MEVRPASPPELVESLATIWALWLRGGQGSHASSLGRGGLQPQPSAWNPLCDPGLVPGPL
jgi:hypothetical protein